MRARLATLVAAAVAALLLAAPADAAKPGKRCERQGTTVEKSA